MAVIQSKNYLAPRPTQFNLFLRTFMPWQLIRFIIINLKMTSMIIKSHGVKIPPNQELRRKENPETKKQSA